MYKISKFSIIFFLFHPVFVGASENTFSACPPVVVETVPKAGLSNVDPSLNEIRVTFSKDMITDQMWSVVMVDKSLFPEITGEVKYLNDKRTFLLIGRGNI